MNLDGTPHSTGLSGDLGWDDSGTPGTGILASAVLTAVSSAYFGSIWLMNGLMPLMYLASQINAPRRRAADRLPHAYGVRSQRS
jgi:hypothetical protein